MHIELTEMLRCPEPHREEFLVLSTGEVAGRMVRSGVVGCPVCSKEYRIEQGVVEFSARAAPEGESPAPDAPSRAGARISRTDAQTLQAVLDLSGPGGIVVLLGLAARHAEGLAGLMGGIHFVGVNAPPGVEELPVLSLLACRTIVPLRQSFARGVVVGGDAVQAPWPDEALRVLLRGRRLVLEGEGPDVPGATRLAVGQGLWVGEKR